MRLRLVYVTAVLLASIVLAALCLPTIPPDDMTQTAITETAVRIHMYMIQHRTHPKDLTVLPQRQHYANRITDGWGRLLVYTVEENGVISLKSLGRDGKPGGDGLDQDIVRQYRTRKEDGTLNIDDDRWIVASEVYAK